MRMITNLKISPASYEMDSSTGQKETNCIRNQYVVGFLSVSWRPPPASSNFTSSGSDLNRDPWGCQSPPSPLALPGAHLFKRPGGDMSSCIKIAHIIPSPQILYLLIFFSLSFLLLSILISCIGIGNSLLFSLLPAAKSCRSADF